MASTKITYKTAEATFLTFAPIAPDAKKVIQYMEANYRGIQVLSFRSSKKRQYKRVSNKLVGYNCPACNALTESRVCGDCLNVF